MNSVNHSSHFPYLYIVLLSLYLTGCDLFETQTERSDESEIQDPADETETVISHPTYFLILDEDAIDSGDRYWMGNEMIFDDSTIKSFTEFEINDDLSELARRRQLRFFYENIGESIWLVSGQVGDEGWFAPNTIPDSWSNAGPTSDGLRNYLGNPDLPHPHNVGPGLGTGDDPEILLDEIPDIIPLRAEGLYGLIDKSVCAVVYESDISINYNPIKGSLQGATRGVVSFIVRDVKYLPGFSSGTLPRIKIEIQDAYVECENDQTLYTSAPVPSSSSDPFDIRPDDPSDDAGYQ
jgi:hypothetical protein